MYRMRQFWRTVFVTQDHHTLEQAQAQLTPAQWSLFCQLQPAEQAHALHMFHMLVQQGNTQPDLLVAALLHDVGKLRYRMNVLERAMVVIVMALAPGSAWRWGKLPEVGWEALPGWRKAFILAEQHPVWGAELAHKAEVSPVSEALIRQHQQPPAQGSEDWKTSLQYKLWLVDNDF